MATRAATPPATPALNSLSAIHAESRANVPANTVPSSSAKPIRAQANAGITVSPKRRMEALMRSWSR